MGVSRLRLSATLACGLIAGLAIACAPAFQAEAAIVAASSMPPAVSVAGTGAATVSVTWRVVRQGLDLPDPGTVRSPSLRILIGGAVAASQPRSLAHALPGIEVNETATFRETILIPESLVYRAAKQRSTLRVVRTFDDGDFPQVAELEVTPSGPGSAVLSVERLSLAFDDDSRLRVVPKDSKLRVVAELSTQGVGLLNAQWEVADGTTTAGQPVFRTLTLVRQGVAGGGRTVITSPPLPTGVEGAALVRLRVLAPGLGFTSPTLQYYVTPGGEPGNLVAEAQVQLTGPRPGSTLTADTRFTWQALAGTAAYKLALYETPGPLVEPGGNRRPAEGADALAASLIPAAETEAGFDAAALANVPGGRSYVWQVEAIDANGAVIGSSSMWEIFKP